MTTVPDGASSQRLKSILTQQFECPPDAVRPEARLRDDLGLDSLDHVDLVLELERFAGRRIPTEELRNLVTVAQVVALMERFAPTSQSTGV